jgi:WD40 repeat protein
LGSLEVNCILAENLDSELQSELQLVWQGQLSERVTALVYSPNGRGWAASSAAGEVIWNAGLSETIVLLDATGRVCTDTKATSSVKDPSQNPNRLPFAERLVGGASRREEKAGFRPTTAAQSTPTIDLLAFSPDSQWLAAGGQAGELLIWNCEDIDLPPQLVSQVDFHKWIEHLVWHPTHPAELAIGCGSQVQIWDVRLSKEIATWQFDKSAIFDLAWHPAGTDLAAAGYKGVQIWSPTAMMAPTQRITVDIASLAVAWSSDGRYLAAGNLDRTLTIVDWHHPEDPWTLQGCPGKIRQIAWLCGASTPCLAVASGNTIVIWSLTGDGTTWEGKLLEGHQDIVEVLVAHHHAPIFASGGADGYACLWSIDGEIAQIITDEQIAGFTALGWHDDEVSLLMGTQVGVVGLWIIPA